VTGTSSIVGTSMFQVLSICLNDVSASIGARSTRQLPCAFDEPSAGSVNAHRCATRLALANWPGKLGLAVYARATPRTRLSSTPMPRLSASASTCVVSSDDIASCSCGSRAAFCASAA